jgi:transmembrane sensor
VTLVNSNIEPEVTADLIAEAAAWLAVLHGPNRTAATERGFSQWMKKSPGHARAFEEATAIWEEARNLPRPRLWRANFRQRPAPRIGFLRSAAIAVVLALFAVGATIYVQRQAGVGTNIGEQRVLALDDGTRVILNTGTRVVVSYDREARRVELKNGEALFEVAKSPTWPFIVTAGDRRIEALGTSFVVRRDNRQLAVTLVEGSVAVSSASPRLSARSAADALRSENPANPGTLMLTPGERIIFRDAQPVKKDRPPLENLLAWQRREVALDNAVLSDAVAEMNRYNRKPMRIASAEAANVRVTGLFRAGDSMSFARAVAEAFDLEITEEPDAIVLSGVPAELRTAMPIHP